MDEILFEEYNFKADFAVQQVNPFVQLQLLHWGSYELFTVVEWKFTVQASIYQHMYTACWMLFLCFVK